jgi:hypothetical protein
VVLFRIPLDRPGEAAARVLVTLGGRDDWAGRFSVVEPERVRMRALLG